MCVLAVTNTFSHAVLWNEVDHHAHHQNWLRSDLVTCVSPYPLRLTGYEIWRISCQSVVYLFPCEWTFDQVTPPHPPAIKIIFAEFLGWSHSMISPTSAFGAMFMQMCPSSRPSLALLPPVSAIGYCRHRNSRLFYCKLWAVKGSLFWVWTRSEYSFACFTY